MQVNSAHVQFLKKAAASLPRSLVSCLAMSGDLDESFNLEAMSATEVSAWMNRQGIPQKYCDIFEGTLIKCKRLWYVQVVSCIPENYIDGTEFIDLTEDVVKSLVPPIGLVKKIMKLRSKVRCLYIK